MRVSYFFRNFAARFQNRYYNIKKFVIIMSTIIYPSPIFGPVNSRRLGVSLGINLMPSDGKVCSFDCLYCECGFNADFRPHKKRPTREEVRTALEQVLAQRKANNEPLDDMTFAGNGEPTGHPDFLGIIKDTIALRDKYFPKVQVSVLSNATYIYKPEVREALMLVENNILKLDTWIWTISARWTVRSSLLTMWRMSSVISRCLMDMLSSRPCLCMATEPTM